MNWKNLFEGGFGQRGDNFDPENLYLEFISVQGSR
jgi:hypothetical protein